MSLKNRRKKKKKRTERKNLPASGQVNHEPVRVCVMLQHFGLIRSVDDFIFFLFFLKKKEIFFLLFRPPG